MTTETQKADLENVLRRIEKSLAIANDPSFKKIPYGMSVIAFKYSYKSGVCDAIRAKLTEAKNAQNNDASTTTRNELVVVKENAIREKFGKVDYVTYNISQSSRTARDAGLAAGSKLDVLRRGVAGNGGADTLAISR